MDLDSKNSEKIFNQKLINFVQANPVLYDPRHRDNRDNNIKVAVFKKFAEENDLETEFVIRRWSNLRNSYQRIKRETRHIPDADGHQKSGKVWIYWESLKFLDSVGPSFSLPEPKRRKMMPKQAPTVQLIPTNNGKISDSMLMFTQTLKTLSDDDTLDDDNGTNQTNHSAALNTHELLQLNNNILTSINDLSGSIKELVSRQAPAPSSVDPSSCDNLTMYLNSLRPLLEPFASDPLGFTKITLKITQLVVDEIEKNQGLE